MTAAPPLEAGTVIAGRYRVEARIGEGGMGSVYLVRHVNTDESLALKLLHAHVLRDANAVERFRREARAPARVNSEHVARVTDADTAPDLDNAPFYVMEYLRGKDLERMLADQGPLSPALAVEYLRQAARALDKAHALGIVHRDLKPENLFLTSRDDGSPCIKLLDFGIARLGDTSAASPMVTQAGFVFGTPAFMAPEQMIGDVNQIGPATDVWALGIVAFKLLTAHDFWGSRTSAQLCAAILSEPIVAPSTLESWLSPAFDAWFARCAAREAKDRFQSAGEAVAQLANALGVSLEAHHASSASFVAASELGPSVGTQAAPTAAPHVASIPPERSDAPPPPKSRRLGLLLGVGAAALLGAGALVYQLAFRTKPADAHGGLVSSATSLVAPSLGAAEDAAAPGPTTSSIPTAPVVVNVEPVRTARAVSDPLPKPKEVIAAKPGAPLTRDQRKRLDSLQRLCDQGTFTPAECQAKRSSITNGP